MPITKKEGTTIEEDIRDLKDQIEKYEDMGCSKNEDVTACVERLSNSDIPINAYWVELSSDMGMCD